MLDIGKNGCNTVIYRKVAVIFPIDVLTTKGNLPMNMKIVSLLSSLVLLNTACSPKQEETPDSAAQSSIASSAAAATTYSETATTPAEVASSAAASSASMDTLAEVALLNTYWKLNQLNNNDVAVVDNQREPHLVFDAEGRVSGSDGCNRLMGTYILADDKLTLGELAGTKMGCADGMEQAQAFNEALAKVASYSLIGDKLEFRDAGNLLIASFQAVALP